jgi:hypothetical protein
LEGSGEIGASKREIRGLGSASEEGSGGALRQDEAGMCQQTKSRGGVQGFETVVWRDDPEACGAPEQEACGLRDRRKGLTSSGQREHLIRQGTARDVVR